MKRGCLFGAIAVCAAAVLVLMIAGPYAQALWFREDAGYLRVFILPYKAQGMLFALSFVPALILYWISMAGLRNQQVIYADEPPQYLQQVVKAVGWFQEKGAGFAKWAAVILAFFTADAFSGHWRDMLLASNAVQFGRTDPIFGLDLSFFVFKLPWYADLAACVCGVLFVCAIIAFAVSFLKANISKPLKVRFAAKGLDPAKFLGGAFLIAFAAQLLINILQSESQPGELFVGPGMSEMVGLHMSYGLVGLVLLGGLYVLITGKRKPAISDAFIAVGPALAWYFIGVVIIPAAVQSLRVEPDKINAETPYAQRALVATKAAFGIQDIQTINSAVTSSPSPKEVAAASSTFKNMRLWDPDVLQSALEATQSFRPYYMFSDVDIDRYMLPDSKGVPQETLVMLSPRDIYLPGLSSEAQTWVNTRLAYTHGYGAAAAEVNQADSMGQPSLIASDIPQTSIPGLKIDQPRLYFSDFQHSDGTSADEYAIVDTKVQEMDYPTDQGQATYKWTGSRGIELDSFARRALFSLVLGDWNLFISTNIKPTSRLIWHRSVLERAQMVYPFLTFDADPYIAIVGGKIYWILDGYTTSDSVPYSQDVNFNGQQINYIRNSVKVVINAYTGEMHAYESGASDPILETYERVYPGLIRPQSEVPAGIAAHFRYPEDMFNAQSEILTLYHVNSASTYLENSDAWAIANARGLNGDKSQIPAYYLMMRLPDAPRDEFLLILPFTPRGRDNMVGWLAAHCDPGHYGELTLYKFPKGDLVNGPAQEENMFVQDRTIADINRNYNNDQSEIIVGNMLVIPVGKSMVYSETLFLQSRTTGIQSIPEMKKVILATKDKIVVANTYEDALSQLFGSDSTSNAAGPATPQAAGSPTAPAASTATSPGGVPRSVVESAASDLQKAEDALKSGDLGSYGQLVKKAGSELNKALQNK